jgi:defect in organelle trafficking protein DotD
MKRELAISVLLSSLFLGACSKNTVMPNSATNVYAGMTQQQIDNQVKSSLTTAAAQTQDSLTELAAIEKMRFQNDTSLPLTDITDPALNTTIKIKWYGPIEPLLQQVASLTGYQLQAFGKAPFSPILINVDDSDNPTTALAIIQNADIQAGMNAQVLVFPDQKIISLRYAGS